MIFSFLLNRWYTDCIDNWITNEEMCISQGAVCYHTKEIAVDELKMAKLVGLWSGDTSELYTVLASICDKHSILTPAVRTRIFTTEYDTLIHNIQASCAENIAQQDAIVVLDDDQKIFAVIYNLALQKNVLMSVQPNLVDIAANQIWNIQPLCRYVTFSLSSLDMMICTRIKRYYHPTSYLVLPWYIEIGLLALTAHEVGVFSWIKRRFAR